MAASAEVMNNPSTEVLEAAVTSVFQPGNHAVELIRADGKTAPTPPMPILVAAPNVAGKYPVAMFLHGFFLQSHFYEQVLKHCASFGFIVVAPQLQVSIFTPTSSDEDIASASKVTDWLTKGLPSVLPEGVNPDVSKLALAGHSQGAHTAFSLALGYGKTNDIKFSALIGIDPVAGQDKSSQVSPKILTYEPSSFNIAMPVLVIGTRLGEQKRYEFLPGPACAPRDVNHREFYRECKPPCYHLVTRDYGHLDMLDDEYVALLFRYFCKEGKNRKDIMRRSVAGIMVAFLKAVLSGEDGDLMVILKDPGLAPATLNPVEYRLA